MTAQISLQQFKTMLTKGQRPENVVLTKSVLPHPVELASEDRKAVFTVSTSTVDRQQDTIDVNGWQTENFMKSPCVLWQHNQDALPIGRVTNLFRMGDSLKAEVEFADATVNPLAEQVYQGIQKGFIGATSVGFRPIEYDICEDRIRSNGYPAVDFRSNELLEISIVNVPANPQAMLDTPIVSEEPKSNSTQFTKAKRSRKLRLMLLG